MVHLFFKIEYTRLFFKLCWRNQQKNVLKNRMFQHFSLPLRVDSFLFEHISAVEGKLALIAKTGIKFNNMFSFFYSTARHTITN